MSITRAFLQPPVTSVDVERALLRSIEAGVYAEHLLASGIHRDQADLQRVAESGKAAWETLWLSNLRLVAKLSHASARRHRLPFDDLFQDGCLGLAQAMIRFDLSRGWRLSTLAHEYIQRAVRASAARRAGEFDGPARQHRLRILLIEQTSAIASAEHRLPAPREVARAVGASVAAAAGATAITTSLDEMSGVQLASDGGFEAVEVNGFDFLNLLADAGELLRLRYGLGTRCHTQVEIAERLRVSPTTVARMEQRALARAKELLQKDQCRLPGAECA